MNEIAKFTDIAISVPEIAEKNQTSFAKAEEARLILLKKIESAGMNAALDLECNTFLVKAKKTIEGMEERRKPITQLLASVSKEFTSLESEMNKNILVIQEHRNQFAKAELIRQREEEEKAKKIKAAEDEKIDFKSKLESQLNDYFEVHLTSEIVRLQAHFDECTIETYEDKLNVIEKCSIIFPDRYYELFTANIPTQFMNSDHKKAVKAELMAAKYDLYKSGFKTEIGDLKKALLDKLPSKLNELKEIAEAEKNNKIEADRLKAAQLQRENESKIELQRQAKERKDEADREANAKADEAKIEILFEAVASVENKQERTGYNMLVSHQAAYVQIFALWFELEGKNLAMDAIEKKTMKQMKTFLESHAHKTGTFITSKFIKYDEIVKVKTVK